MARTKFSALFSDALGKVGDIVCSKWKGIPYVRRRVDPSNPRSGKQMRVRYVMAMSLSLWQSIKAWADAPWNVSASGYAMSGYNQFMSQCIDALLPQFTEGATGEDPTLTTPAITVASPFNEAYPALADVAALTPGDGTLSTTWTARVGADADSKVLPLYRLDDADSWTADSVILESAETVTISGLSNDSQYEVALVPYDNGTGAYGQSSHKLGTPAA